VSAVLVAPPAVDVYTASYDLLARFYLAGPSALRRELLPPVDPLLDAWGHVNPDWPARVEDLLSRHDQPTELERAQSAYLECLVLPVPGRYVPPYASVYLDSGMLWGESTFKVLRLYETEGLSWQRHRPGPAGGTVTVTAPDHVGVEFAFLALATSRSGRGRAGVERQQRLAAFLRDHSTRWLVAFSDALVAAGAGPVLEGWTDWAADVVQADVRRRFSPPDQEP
jgi:TorA maturation chaperone TorD